MLKPGRSILVVCGCFVEILLSDYWHTYNIKFMVDKIEESSQIINMCWNGRNVQMKNGQVWLFVYFRFFEIWNIIIVTAKWIFRLLKYLTHFKKLFQLVFCLLVHFFRNWLKMIVMRIIENIWRSLFLTVTKGNSMMQ